MPAVAEGLLAVDTSLAVPLLLQNHPFHRAADHWRGQRALHLSGHDADHGATLASRDARAEPVYRRVGASVEMVT